MNSHKIIFFLVLMYLTSPSLRAQVSLAPVAAVIHDDTNIGSIYVANRSDTPQEILVELNFGYPGSDSLGNLVMNYSDSEAKERYQLNDMIRVYPRSFVLGPDQQQTIRLQVIPDSKRADGVYWSRISIISNDITPEVGDSSQTTISTRVDYRYEQNISVFYQKGGVTTGVEIKDISVDHQGNTLIAMPHLIRKGNSPFLGNMYAVLYNSDGKKVRDARSTTTVYFDEIRRLGINTKGLPPGQYRLDMHFETKRGDIPRSDLVQAPRTTKSISINL